MADISQLQDFPSETPVTRDYFQNWNIRVVNGNEISCENYLSPNRRDFYKILFIEQGEGMFSIGTKTYHIKDSTIFFLHPNEIISWRSFSNRLVGHYCLFKKRYVETYPSLQAAMDRHRLFSDSERSIVKLDADAVRTIDGHFQRLHEHYRSGDSFAEEAMQAYLQLLILESIKSADFPIADGVSEEYGHVHHFFRLLEEEASHINQESPIRIRTAQEFADHLSLSPNYLNALLKKHTGQNVSSHIKNRLLEESKVLLLQTDWSLSAIGASIGFAEQPNFTQFFKKNLGVTPSEFRKSYAS